MHVDEFIDDMYGKDNYARFVLNMFRFPAILRTDFDEYIKKQEGMLSAWRTTTLEFMSESSSVSD